MSAPAGHPAMPQNADPHAAPAVNPHEAK
jgi:hypothetical protein